MAYSSIIKKKCKCSPGCPLWPTLGASGYNISHHPDPNFKQNKIDQAQARQKTRTAATNASNKLRREISPNLMNNEAGRKWDELQIWFKERRKEMTGVCCECGKTTSKNNEKYYRWSICHITPKSLVPSVATNEYNWIELCQQHHQEFDNTFDKAAAMMCFGEIKQKFQLFKNLIPPEELRKINPHLLK